MLRQIQQLRGSFDGMGESLRAKRAVGSAGAGMVAVEINGLMEVTRCTIDQKLFSSGDREVIEDLVVTAVNQAVAKSRDLHVEAIKSLSGGIDVSNLGEMMSNLMSGGSHEPQRSA